jgi:hypothetical protein
MAAIKALIQIARQLVKETLPHVGVLLHPRHVVILLNAQVKASVIAEY